MTGCCAQPPAPAAAAAWAAAQPSPAGSHLLDKDSKFQPLSRLPAAAQPTPCVTGAVPRGASILLIKQPWIGLILDGRKSLEIRSQACNKRERIYLAESGGGGIVLGSVELVRCLGPLRRDEWTSRATEHCVAGDKLPYGCFTYAWEMRKPIRFSTPVPYHHKQGVVVWAKV